MTQTNARELTDRVRAFCCRSSCNPVLSAVFYSIANPPTPGAEVLNRIDPARRHAQPNLPPGYLFQVAEEGVILISGRKARVLVIDDDSSVADTLAMVLNASGFDATAAYSGETALELARLAAFDSVVADVMMEPMNAIQTALAISLIHPGCQVLLISGNDRTSQLLQDAMDAGHAFTILAKPVYPSVIINYLLAAVATVADICPGGLPE